MLTNISTLTFSKGQFTTGRRQLPVPQLYCIAGTATCIDANMPSAVQCYNRGSSGAAVQVFKI